MFTGQSDTIENETTFPALAKLRPEDAEDGREGQGGGGGGAGRRVMFGPSGLSACSLSRHWRGHQKG